MKTLLLSLCLLLLVSCGPADPIAEGQTPPVAAPLPAGQWLPVLSADTPCDMATTVSQDPNINHGIHGDYVRHGNLVWASFRYYAKLTWTCASGYLKIEGLPLPMANVKNSQTVGPFTFQGIVKPNYTQFGVIVFPGTDVIRVFAAGQAMFENQLLITEIPSGGNVLLEGSVMYLTDAP